jgi:hypothetical protein
MTSSSAGSFVPFPLGWTPKPCATLGKSTTGSAHVRADAGVLDRPLADGQPFNGGRVLPTNKLHDFLKFWK